MKLGVITNPHSKKNRGRSNRASELQSIVGDQGKVRQTRDVDEIKDALREFLHMGATHWVSDGGDGALHWMLNQAQGVMAEREFRDKRWPLAVPTNGGTIDFVAKKAGIKGKAEGILHRLVQASQLGETLPTVPIDSFIVEGEQVTAQGVRPFRRLGFAGALAGAGQRVIEHYYEEDPHPGPGTVVKVIAKSVSSYIFSCTPLAALAPGLTEYGLRTFQPFQARVVADGQELPYGSFGAINVGSIDINIGGVIRVFGLARTPGKLHLQAGGISPKDMIFNLWNLWRGNKIRSKELYDAPGEEMEVYALNGELLNPVIDGECFTGLRYLKVTRGPKIQVPKVVALA